MSNKCVAMVGIIGMLVWVLCSHTISMVEPQVQEKDRLGDFLETHDTSVVTLDEQALLALLEENDLSQLATTDDAEHTLEGVMALDMIRLGVDKKDWAERARRFLDFVKIVESEGNRYAQAPTSTAMSFYQFTIPSVPTAVNRLKNYMARHGLGSLPLWAVELRHDPRGLFELAEYRQKILAMVNIIEQRGSDRLLREYLGGKTVAAKTLYYTFHHTAPDQATRKRVELVFAQVFAD